MVAEQFIAGRGLGGHNRDRGVGIFRAPIPAGVLRCGGAGSGRSTTEGGGHPGLDTQWTAAAGNPGCLESIATRPRKDAELPTAFASVWERHECVLESFPECRAGGAATLAALARAHSKARRG